MSKYYNCKIHFTFDRNEYINFSGVKINYTPQPVNDDEIWIMPHGLLFENEIRVLEINCQDHKDGFKVLFPFDDDIGFDFFSAIFYLISRYEEYLPHKKDSYGRYAHENSTAFQHNFLQFPLINIWLEHFKKITSSKTGKHFADSNYKFQPTYDIDIAWSYKNKGFLRNAGGIIKSITGFRFKEVKNRIAVLTGSQQDPYDTYNVIEELNQQFNLKPIYFFHVGLKKSIYDKNIFPKKLQMLYLIKSIAEKNKIGLHPSWISGDKDDLLLNEKKLLERIISKKIDSSRQHYIRLSFPETYRKLIDAGISNDYSMGYGSINGFRASITTSFYWYDLQREEQTNLLLHPFCFMDANSLYEQKQNAEQTSVELMHYLSEVKKVNGTLITIWHNNFFGTDAIFAGWANIYKSFLSNL